jgi:hypothetical protein
MRDQIIELFAGGFSKDDVAKTLGISLKLIDETLKEPEVLTALAQKAKELQSERIEKRYGDLEEAALKQLKTDVSMLSATELCRILETTAKNRIAARTPAGHFQNPTALLSVTLVLPQPALAEKVVVDSKNQVVSIGNRNMAPLPSSSVQKLFTQLSKESNIEDVDDLFDSPTQTGEHNASSEIANAA